MQEQKALGGTKPKGKMSGGLLTTVKTSQDQLTGEKMATGEMTIKMSCPG
jgi:hypothetical protein